MELNKLYEVLHSLRLSNGFYLASSGEFYTKVWLRDCYYAVMPELKRNPELYKQTYQTWLDYYIKIENKYNKLTSLIKSEAKYGYEYPHPKIHPNLEEIDEDWGRKQLDNFGEFLHGLWLGESNGLKIIRDNRDREIINLLIKCLEAVEYWWTEDNAIWEENCEVHSSSVGACLCGLTAIRLLGFEVDQILLDKAHTTLNKLLPKESITKDVDMALLTLIFPFNIIDPFMARQILHNVESKLLRNHGVIRYIGDMYYNSANKENIKSNRYYDEKAQVIGSEANWVMGFGFLGLTYLQLGDVDKAKYYLKQLEKCEVDGKMPELYYANIDIPNDNTPLAWTNALTILLMEQINELEE